MWWLCRSAAGVGLLALLLAGCGSATDDDRQVLRFVSFDGVGINQADSVRANSADVDVVPSLCEIDMEGNLVFEPFTQTTVNAVFFNEQKSDILLERVEVDAGSRSGLGVINESISANLPGGRCDNVDRRCAVASDCIDALGETGECLHTQTIVPGILLFDFLAKAAVNPEILGEATNVTITFRGTDDTDESFRVTTGYVVTFANFDNCEETGGGAGGS